MNDGFEDILSQASADSQALARKARALIQDVMPGVIEVAWPKQKIAGYGVGPKKMSEQFCYIWVLKARINLGFYYGSELPDPEGLLEGTGELMRHVKITSLEQLDNPALRQLVEAASRHLPRLNRES
jgi:hypothetical protein